MILDLRAAGRSLDPADLGRHAPLAQGIAADLALTLGALLPKLVQRRSSK